MGKVHQHYVFPIMSDTQIKQREGTHFDSTHYSLIINQDATGRAKPKADQIVYNYYPPSEIVFCSR